MYNQCIQIQGSRTVVGKMTGLAREGEQEARRRRTLVASTAASATLTVQFT
jgi:hypothetical protein